MALANKDPQTIKADLEAWLRMQLPDAGDVAVTDLKVPQASGMSNLTILFDVAYELAGEQVTEQLVARVAPEGPAVFMQYDLAKEFEVMGALAEHTAVPVPRVRWLEEDLAVLGAPFLVMERAVGEIAGDDPPFTTGGWVLELDDAAQRRLCETSLETLAHIHAADWRALGLESLLPADGGDPFDAELALWRDVDAWARAGDADATVDAGWAWLEAHRPADDREPVLSWGDARIGNMMFAPDQSVTAVLDWEMVGLGPAEAEVAWYLFLLRHHTEGIGAPMPPGFPSREELVAIYEQASGREVRDLGFYEVWAAVRLSIIMHRAGNLMIEVGLLPPDAPMKVNNPASQLLAKLVGADAPTGESQSFIGNR